MKVKLLHFHILKNPWLTFYNLKIIVRILYYGHWGPGWHSCCYFTNFTLLFFYSFSTAITWISMDISHIRCSARMLHCLPNERFLHRSKQRYRSPHCSRHFLILYIKPNNKSCWLHLWSLSWTASISPNLHCFNLTQTYIIFHWDSCKKLLTHPASTLPFCSLFPT